MKTKSILIFVALITVLGTQNALAAGREGNGGNAVVCRDANKKILTAELLDYYEARVMRGMNLTLGSSSSVRDDFNFLLNRLAQISPKRVEIFSSWADRFSQDSVMIPNITLLSSEDSHHIIIPDGCSVEQVVVQRAPEFPGDRLYTISKDVWDSLNAANQAGLMLHEFLYREALTYGHQDSVAVRYFNSVVATLDGFSAIKTDQDIFNFMNLVNFGVTDFHGIRYVVSGIYAPYEVKNNCNNKHPGDIRFAPNGQILDGQIAYPLQDATVLRKQSLHVQCDLEFYPSSQVKSISIASDHYVDPFTQRTYSGDLTFFEDGRVRSGDSSSFRHPLSGLLLGGTVELSDDNQVLKAQLLEPSLKGANFNLVGAFGQATLNPNGTVQYVDPINLDPNQSWVLLKGAKVSIRQAINQYLVISAAGYLQSGFYKAFNETTLVPIQGNPVQIDYFELYEDGSLHLLGSNEEAPIRFQVAEKSALLNSGSMALFSQDRISCGMLAEDTTLQLASGKSQRFAQNTLLIFNENGQVTGSYTDQKFCH